MKKKERRKIQRNEQIILNKPIVWEEVKIGTFKEEVKETLENFIQLLGVIFIFIGFQAIACIMAYILIISGS